MRARDKTGAALWDEYLDDIRDRVSVFISQSGQQWSDPELAKLERPTQKPEELIFTERLDRFGLPFLPGGYVDQPLCIIQILDAVRVARAMYRPSGGA